MALVESADGTTADNVYGFYSFDDQAGVVTATAGLANGLSSVDIGQAGAGESLIIRKSDADNPAVADSGAYTVNTSPTKGSIPCFCPGTLITTVLGQKPIETLAAGDLVVTMDNGLQPIRWIGRRTVSGIARFDPRMRPVTITAQTAPISPAAPLRVSPNHRFLIRHAAVQALFGVPEALVAAQFIAPLDAQSTQATLPSNFEYIHLLFDQLEVIFANGAPAESLHPGHVALSAFGMPGKLLNLAGIHTDYGPTAQRCLHRWGARALMAALTEHSGIDQHS
ncbi:MAG: Hint domain-containing protein [Pseudomonadota bacterium]